MRYPHGSTYDPASECLFVADPSDNRILEFSLGVPNIFLSTTSLTYTAAFNATSTDQGTQTVLLGNPSTFNTSTLNWTATSSAPWLTLDTTSGSISPNATTSIGFLVDPSSLSAGIYYATATIADPGAGDSPETVDVTLTVGSLISLSPSTLNYTASLGTTSTNEGTQEVNLQNTGDGTLNWTATSSEPWLTFDTTSGSLSSGSTTNIGFLVDPSSLSLNSGTYNATATIADPNAANSPQTVGVTLTVAFTGDLASALLGQTDAFGNPVWTTNNQNNGSSSVNAQGFSGPEDAALDSVNHRLFVTDNNNNRVLVFNLDENNNIVTTTASYVIGQSDFVSNNTTTPTQSGMSQPQGLAYDPTDSRLFVADTNNNRVLVFDASTSTLSATPEGENAEDVIGQSDFVSNNTTTPTQSGMSQPQGLAYDPTDSRLFVADSNNNRVLVFDASTSTLSATPEGENAEDVIGQSDFVSNNTTTPTQSGMSQPQGLAYDPTDSRLFVADSNNNRVLVFDASTSTLSATPEGENAEDVIGQSDFVSGGGNTTQSGMSQPQGLAYDPTDSRLFVADSNNNRVLVFDASTLALAATPEGENAEDVIGQSDFVSGGGNTTQSGMSHPQGLTYDSTDSRLFVGDTNNNRVMEFSFVTVVDPELPDGTVGTAYSATVNTTSSQGTPSFSLSSGSLPAGRLSTPPRE